MDGVSKRFGTDIAKKLRQLNKPGILYGKYIISLIKFTSTDLQTMFKDLPVKQVVTSREVSPTGKRVYGFNPKKNKYTEGSSLEKCTYDLTSNRFENKSIVNLRIDKKILYYDYYLQTVPFKEE